MANQKHSENYLKVIENSKISSTGVVTPQNLLMGILLTPESMAARVLEQLGLRPVNKIITYDKRASYSLTTLVQSIIKQADSEATRLNSETVRSEHILLSIVRSNTLENITVSDVERILENIGSNDSSDDHMMDDGYSESKSNNGKSALSKYCINLNDRALAGKLDPIVGRETEMKRIEQILARRNKNNPVLIGESGVGKTSIINALAQRIVSGQVCETLKNKKILIMDMSTIVAGTKFRGEFEERLKQIIDEITKDGNYIVYVDEIHTMVGAGSSAGSLDAANILKPALARGDFSCIGSTTLKEYRTIEKDGALERRFQKVIINEPTMSETKTILYKLKSKYEEFHGVTYTDEVISECLTMANRYLYERKFPDKAIDVLDEVGSYVKIRRTRSEEILKLEDELAKINEIKIEHVKAEKFEMAAKHRADEIPIMEKIEELKKIENSVKIPVTKEDVYAVMSTMTGIPSKSINEDEMEKFISLERNIKSVFVGQDEAVDKVTRSLIRNKAGLGNSNKPIGVFLFTGSTGVGKTFLAKLLAKNLFNSEEDVIRVDMSEYMEKASVSRLIGASPGYIGYEEGGQLTEKVRRKPYSIILLDEVEKAHADVWNILLQVFDDGMLTDSQGKTVSFKNTIIIMTSNVGSKKASQFSNSVGFGSTSTQSNNSANIIDKEIKSLFTPEFLNRIDDIIKFNSLSKTDINNIVNIELNKFATMLFDNNNITINFDSNVVDFILSKGWDEKMGARPIKRAIQRLVEDEVSIMVLKRTVKSSDIITATYTEGDEAIKFAVTKDDSILFKKVEEGIEK